MSDPQGLYETLGLQPGASEEEIKASYRTLIRKYHPDFGTETKAAKEISNKEEREKKLEEILAKCKKINEAKTVLLDAEQRQIYDRPPQQDIFDIFDFFGGKRKEKKEKTYQVEVSFPDSYTGKEVSFLIKRKKECKKCFGKGGKEISKCTKCRGTGKIKKESRHGFFVTINDSPCNNCINGEIIKEKCLECKGTKCFTEEVKKTIFIPAGTENNDKFVLSNEGDEVNGKKENIFVRVVVHASPTFFRVKNHVVMKKEVNLYEALSGGSIFLEFIDGRKLKINLKEANDLTKAIKVKGLGFKKGDLFIQPVYKFKAEKEEKKVILRKEEKEEAFSATYSSEYSDLPEEEEEEVRSGFFGSGFFGM